MYSSIEEGGGFAGTMGETFQLMGSAMNFTYDAVPSIDGNYGNQVKKSRNREMTTFHSQLFI